jgi:hypothetical protein
VAGLFRGLRHGVKPTFQAWRLLPKFTKERAALPISAAAPKPATTPKFAKACQPGTGRASGPVEAL